MRTRKYQKKNITATEAYTIFGVTRSWVREHCEVGKIRKTVLKGTGADGKPFIRNLYNVKDIENIINENIVKEEPKY